MEKLLVSACLVGENCRYAGKNCVSPFIEKLKSKYYQILALVSGERYILSPGFISNAL